VGYLNRLRAHLYVFHIDTKAVTQITSGDYEDYSPAWSPDGSKIAPVWHPDGEGLAYITTTRTDVPVSYLQTKLAIIRVGEDEPVLLTTESLDR